MKRFTSTYTLLAVLIVVVLAVFVSPSASVLALLFSITAWWVWQNPVGGLLLFVVLAPILPMLKFTQTGGALTLIKDVIIITLFLRQVALPLLKKQLPYRRNPLVAPLILLALWVLVGIIRADSLVLGVLRARDIALYIMLYAAVLYLPLNRLSIRKLATWTAATMLLVAALGLYQWFAAADSAILRFDPDRSIWIPRISSILGHPSVFGEYLILAALTLAVTWITLTKAHYRLALLSASLALLPLLFLTYSRGVWIGYLVGMTTIALAWYLHKRAGRLWSKTSQGYAIAMIITLFMLLIIGFQLTPLGTFIRSSIDPAYASNAIRLEFAARLIAPLSAADALIGVGLGDVAAKNFGAAGVGAQIEASGAARAVQLAKDATLVDNQHLKTFVELGLIGLLIYCWLYWCVGNVAWQVIITDGEKTKLLGYTALGFLAAFIVQGLFIDIWDIFPTNAMFWILAAFLVSSTTPTVQQQL